MVKENPYIKHPGQILFLFSSHVTCSSIVKPKFDYSVDLGYAIFKILVSHFEIYKHVQRVKVYAIMPAEIKA